MLTRCLGLLLASVVTQALAGTSTCSSAHQDAVTRLETDDSTSLIQQRSPSNLTTLEALDGVHKTLVLRQESNLTSNKVGALESRLRSLAEKSVSGETLPEGMVDIVEGIITSLKAITDGTRTEHTNDVAILNKAKEDLDKCGEATTKAFKQSGGIDAQKVGVTEKRKTHADCRADEKNDLQEKDHACDSHETYLTKLKQGVPACASKLNGATASEALACMKEVDAWYAEYNYASLNTKSLDCTDKTDEYTKEKETCDSKQKTFEKSFCSLENVLTGTCTQQNECRDKEITSKDEVCQLVLNNAAVRKDEFKSINMAQCFVNVLKIDDKQIDQKKAKFKKCEEEKVDDSSFEIACPATPTEVTCDLTDVTNKPCDTDWTEAEYSSQPWHDMVKAKCEACSSQDNSSPSGPALGWGSLVTISGCSLPDNECAAGSMVKKKGNGWNNRVWDDQECCWNCACTGVRWKIYKHHSNVHEYCGFSAWSDSGSTNKDGNKAIVSYGLQRQGPACLLWGKGGPDSGHSQGLTSVCAPDEDTFHEVRLTADGADLLYGGKKVYSISEKPTGKYRFGCSSQYTGDGFTDLAYLFA